VKIDLKGDWGKASQLVTGMAARFTKAADQALMKEAHLLRGNIIKNLSTGGAHAGKPFAPLSKNTLLIRAFKGFGGSKPLNVTGGLRGSVAVIRMGNAVFVGVKRSGKGGAKLAALHEFGGGPWTRVMTAKQRRFLMAAFKASGASGGGAGGGGTITTRIKARPFVGPAVEAFHSPKDVQRRYYQNISAAMGFGK
jgi:hypothetical protein